MGSGKFDHHRRVGVDIERRLEIVAKIFRISFFHGNPPDLAMGLSPGRLGGKTRIETAGSVPVSVRAGERKPADRGRCIKGKITQF